MAEKKTKKNEDTVEETPVAESTEPTEAAAPSVDEGAPMASTEAMDAPDVAEEAATEVVVPEEVPAADEAMVAVADEVPPAAGEAEVAAEAETDAPDAVNETVEAE